MRQVEGFSESEIIEKFIEFQIKERSDCEPFIRNLIKRKIITMPTMIQYCIVKSYDDYLRSNKGVIKETLFDLSIDYGLFHGHIRKIHKKYSRVF